MGKKKKYEVDIAAVIKGGENEWGSVYRNMYTHKNFIALPPSAKHLYAVCRIHIHTEKQRRNLWKYKQELMKLYGLKEENELFTLGIPLKVFVFPSIHAIEYGFDKGNFSRNMTILKNAGFIKKVVAGKEQKKQNLYAFSSEWKGEQE